MRWEGVFVATITPFDAGGNLCLKTLEAHLDFLASAGVHGFVPCATTGESPTISPGERKEILRITVEKAKRHRITVMAGCGTNNTQTVLELLAEAKDLGCDAALVVTPYYNKPTVPGLIAHYEYLAERSKLPLCLYNIPSRTNVSLPADAVVSLFKNEMISGIKESSGSYAQWLSLASQTDLSKKSLLSGDDDAFAPILALGGTGIISAAANLIPDLFVSLYNLTRDKKWEEAFQLQKKLFPLIRALFLETNPAPVKFALHLLKKMEATVRLPLVSVTKDTQLAIYSEMNCLGLL